MIIVMTAIFVRSVVLRDRARVVPTDEALEVFRAESSESGTSAAPVTQPAATLPADSTTTTIASTMPTLVEPGIYRYTTSGSEDVDALGGTAHTYPAETTITVVARGCGVDVRWVALRERRDEWGLCATAEGIELQPEGVQYHEFYGQPNEEVVSCHRPVVVVPANAATADLAQSQSCTLGGDTWLPLWEVLERTTRWIDGAEIDVQHVRMSIDDNDEYWEHTVVDWYLADSGLPVEVHCTKESRSPSPIGAVVYHEQFNLEVVSLVPLR